jgi:hypothetical protein
MWIEKLAVGVLRVLTPIGPRYVQLSFWQRVYLLWVFRHFQSLPPKVLTQRQQRMVERLCAEDQFVSWSHVEDVPVVGTIEQRPPVEAEGFGPEYGHAVQPADASPLAARQRS